MHDLTPVELERMPILMRKYSDTPMDLVGPYPVGEVRVIDAVTETESGAMQ